MCTPENLRPLCSCPHLAWSRLRAAAGLAVAAAVVGEVWWLAAAGYGWVLILAAWLLVMAVAGVVRLRVAGYQQPHRSEVGVRRHGQA